MRRLLAALAVAFVPLAAAGQQTGGIAGTVTTADGEPPPGISVEARSAVLPRPRTAITAARGEFRLPLLAPGEYTVEFRSSAKPRDYYDPRRLQLALRLRF